MVWWFISNDLASHPPALGMPASSALSCRDTTSCGSYTIRSVHISPVFHIFSLKTGVVLLPCAWFLLHAKLLCFNCSFCKELSLCQTHIVLHISVLCVHMAMYIAAHLLLTLRLRHTHHTLPSDFVTQTHSWSSRER